MSAYSLTLREILSHQNHVNYKDAPHHPYAEKWE